MIYAALLPSIGLLDGLGKGATVRRDFLGCLLTPELFTGEPTSRQADPIRPLRDPRNMGQNRIPAKRAASRKLASDCLPVGGRVQSAGRLPSPDVASPFSFSAGGTPVPRYRRSFFRGHPMVTRANPDNRPWRSPPGSKGPKAEGNKIGASTPYDFES
jgi:hypothetical protein